jgi:hypothetical protein
MNMLRRVPTTRYVLSVSRRKLGRRIRRGRYISRLNGTEKTSVQGSDEEVLPVRDFRSLQPCTQRLPPRLTYRLSFTFIRLPVGFCTSYHEVMGPISSWIQCSTKRRPNILKASQRNESRGASQYIVRFVPLKPPRRSGWTCSMYRTLCYFCKHVVQIVWPLGGPY